MYIRSLPIESSSWGRTRLGVDPIHLRNFVQFLIAFVLELKLSLQLSEKKE